MLDPWRLFVEQFSLSLFFNIFVQVYYTAKALDGSGVCRRR